MADSAVLPRAEPHPGLVKFLESANLVLEADPLRGMGATPGQVRRAMAGMTAKFGPTPVPVARAEDALFAAPQGDIPVRCYLPTGAEAAPPVCVYLHGGGHLAGSVEVYDAICRHVAQASGALVVSVDYRLAPEAPYPAGLDDARAVVAGVVPWLRARGWQTNGRLFVAGDSAGGALTATLACETSRDAALPKLDAVALIYPSLDYTLSQPSLESNGQGFLLERARIQWYFNQYFAHGGDPRAASPLFMPFVASRFPPALVLTAGLCPLRDEAAVWMAKLRAAGVAVDNLHFADQIHAYLNLNVLVPEACEQSYAAIGDFFRRYNF